ncbi:MAG: hypothetical protein QW515_04465 [Thermoplasmatales archaeon]
MTGTKVRVPEIDGKIGVYINGSKFEIDLTGHRLEIRGRSEDFSSLLQKLRFSISSLKIIRSASRMLSDLGISLKIYDEKGIVIKAGKGAWSPLGRLIVSPRVKKLVNNKIR